MQKTEWCSNLREQDVLQGFKNKGYEQFVNAMLLDLNAYGQSKFIRELTLSEGFHVYEYQDTSKAINDTHLLLRHRGPSALRLRLLLKVAIGTIAIPTDIISSITGVKCFKVTSKQNIEHFDIVAVLSDGSFASSDPRTANYGMPCRDVLAVVIAGYAELNFIWHFHQMYQNDFVTNIKSNAEISSKSTCNLATNIKDSRCRVTSNARFDIAENVTRASWLTESNLEAFCLVNNMEELNEKEIVKKEPYKDRVKKAFYYMKDSLTQGSKAAGLFWQAYETIMSDALNEAVAKKNALASQYGITTTNIIPTVKGSAIKKRMKANK